MAAVALLCGAALSLSAQKITPSITIHKGKVKTRFELTNKTLVPANVIIEAQSFSFTEDGNPLFRPLDDTIHLKLASMSLRIPPRQSRFVFYEVEADQYPAWFIIYSTFGRKPDQETLNLQFRIGHTVYLMQKDPLVKADVEIIQAEFQPEESQVVVAIRNNSPRLGRVLDAEIKLGGKNKKLGNFPLFPDYTRRFTIPWECASGSGQVRIKFKKFELKQRFDIGSYERPSKCDDPGWAR